MADYPYILTTGKIPAFFNHIQTAGIPKRVTNSYLESVGFTSSNDRPLITILKFIGFLDSNGVPTDQWKTYRDRNQAGVGLASSIKKGYSDLFNTYPNAHRLDEGSLVNYFSANSELGERAVQGMSGTFQALCGLANFSGEEVPVAAVDIPAAEVGRVATPEPATVAKPGKEMSININVQITLPESKDSQVYDNIFKAMKNHLLSDE